MNNNTDDRQFDPDFEDLENWILDKVKEIQSIDLEDMEDLEYTEFPRASQRIRQREYKKFDMKSQPMSDLYYLQQVSN